MNLAEKIASAYLRLNGFLTIPHFNMFDGAQHNHVDIVGLRAANSRELVGQTIFPTDDLLFNELSDLFGRDARSITVGIVAEARTNADRDEPSNHHSD
jgi:hypothetical protein